MAPLTFADTHNMIVFLTKSDASEGFDQIVNFLNAHVLQYALMTNDVVRLQALIDRKKVIIIEDTIRQALRLDDADGSPLCTHTLKNYVKEEFLLGKEKRLVEGLAIKAQVDDLSTHNTKYTSPALTQKVFANMWRIGKGFLGVDTPLFDGKLVQQQVQDVEDAAEDENDDHELTLLWLIRRMHPNKGGTTKLDADENVTLEEIDAEVTMDADVQGRLVESQAKLYHLDLQHTEKVLSMQDTDEAEPAKVKEVIEVVTATKLMTEIVTTAATTITAAQVPKASAPRRWRGVIIQDPKETTTASDEAFARELEAEINVNINWNDVMEQVKRKEKQDNTFMRYQALKRKAVTKAQTRKNMMIYLKNMAGFKMDFFKGMTYTDIIPIFEKHYNLNQAFLERVKEWVRRKKREMILLVEKKYPLTRFTLEQMLNIVRLEVEEESEMSLELLGLGGTTKLDADENVTLEEIDAEVTMDADVQGRLVESQAKLYHLDLQHTEKVLSMQDTDEAEPAKVEEVIKVVTATKLITEVVTTAATTITAAQVPKASAPRRRRGVIIQDPKETTTASVIMHFEVNSKDKGKALQFELSLLGKSKRMGQKEDEGSKRKRENLNQDVAKKQRIDEETEELKTHLQIVANDDEDVYTEATPLALKVPVVDYQIHHEHNKPYYKIIRADGTHQLFLSFITLLKNFDREDLEMSLMLKLAYKEIKEADIEKKYPLTRFTLEQMLNIVRLEVEEESEMSLELLRSAKVKGPTVELVVPDDLPVATVQERLDEIEETLEALLCLLNKVTDTLNRFASILNAHNKGVPSASKSTASPAEEEKNTNPVSSSILPELKELSIKIIALSGEVNELKKFSSELCALGTLSTLEEGLGALGTLGTSVLQTSNICLVKGGSSVKVLMALAEDNDAVSKECARNGVDQLTKDPSGSGQKDIVFVKSSANNTKVSIPYVERPWLSESKGFTLPNHNTGRILPPESQRNTTDPLVAIIDSSAIDYDLADESSVCSTPLSLMKKLDGVEPVFGPKIIK
nr:hypothetical protein [Tanacetum cinerariifolium]